MGESIDYDRTAISRQRQIARIMRKRHIIIMIQYLMQLGVVLLYFFIHSGFSHAQPLKIPYAALAGAQLPLFIGETAGLFKKNRLDVQLIYIPGGSVLIQTMLSGEAGIGSLGPPTGMAAWAKGAELVLVAGGIERPIHVVMASRKIKTVDDLKGKRIGISRYGSLTDVVLGEALRYHKLTPGRDVVIIQVGGLAERVAALTSGLIDGAILQIDQMFQLEKLGYPVLIDLRTLPFTYSTQGILVSREFLRKKRDTVKAFLRVYAEGIKILKTERKLSMETLQKYVKIRDPQALSQTYDVYEDVFEKVPFGNRNSLNFLVNAIPEFAAKSSTLNLNNFIDNTINQELEREGFFKLLYPESPNR